jgi:hypothetical protein
MATLILLLPAVARLAGRLPTALAAALGRADTVHADVPGERAQLLRHFDVVPRGWPIAALTRQRDAADAAGSMWLRADPAWVRPDISGARLFACGNGLQPTQDDCDALLPSLRPLFGDAGFVLDAPAPSRWYLRLPPGSTLPAFTDPGDALGADVFEYLPDDAQVEGVVARRWRALLNDAQVVLHNHPWNARRVAAGKPPINSLWFWGAGTLPAQVRGACACVESGDDVLAAFASAAGCRLHALSPAFAPGDVDADRLVDLRGQREPAALSRDWLMPAIAAMGTRRASAIRLDFPDVAGLLLRPGQRWRFWRKPLAQFSDLPLITAQASVAP